MMVENRFSMTGISVTGKEMAGQANASTLEVRYCLVVSALRRNGSGRQWGIRPRGLAAGKQIPRCARNDTWWGVAFMRAAERGYQGGGKLRLRCVFGNRG